MDTPDSKLNGELFAGKKKYLVLVTASLVSLTFSLCLLEGLLELGGRVFVYTRDRNIEAKPRFSGRRGKEVINVLALGDSFTFGGFGLYSSSFPRVLNGLIEKERPGLVSVTNHGVCESTSKDLLNNLGGLITFSRPDIVLVLTGSTNLYDPYPFADELMSTVERYDSFFRRRHVFKLFRHIYYELSAKYRKWREEPDGASARLDLTGGFNPYLAALQREQSSNSAAPPPMHEQRAILTEQARKPDAEGEIARGLLAYLDNDEETAVAIFRRVKKSLNVSLPVESEEFLFHWLWRRIQMLDLPVNQRKVARKLLFLLRLAPPERSRMIVELLIQQCWYDSSVVPKLAVEAIDDAFAYDPLLYRNRRLTAARAAFANMETWRRHVGSWFEQDLRSIISTCRNEEIEVVLQTYPISYEPINTIARKVARELRLPLVDHEAVFDPLISRDREKYIEDSQHCTELGHELMAANVKKVLDEAYLRKSGKVAGLKAHFGLIPPPE